MGRWHARERTLKLLNLPDPPTAIFAANDVLAFGVMEAVREMGLRIPQDLSVVGYDDLELTEYFNLTTIRQPFFVTGVEGVELLLKSMAEPLFLPRQVVLPVELVVRGTTASPNT